MNKHALITGTSSGIGFSLACRLLEKGWNVTGVGRHSPEFGSKAYNHIECDFRFWKEISPFKLNRQVDLLILNSGITVYKKAAELTSQQLEKVYNVNLFGNLRVLQNAFPYFHTDSRVVFISSAAVDNTYQNWSAYSSSKTAVEKHLSIFAEEEKIRCTSIRIGPVDTAIWDSVEGPEKLKERAAPDMITEDIISLVTASNCNDTHNYFSVISI